MTTRLFSLVPEEYYHVYNRGNSKQKIFLDARDYERFVTSLFVLNSTESFKLHFIENPYVVERGQRLVSIGAYCLMPNHFHILLTPLVEGGISLFMKKVMTGYVMYFNNRYERTGALFEGRFKARHVNDDAYMRYLYAYIHLNPVKLVESNWKNELTLDTEKIRTYLRNYAYSSFKDYAGEQRKENSLLNREVFPEYFPLAQDFERSIFGWFEENKQVGPV